MASQYIKIFNDTVLKQSILQGEEAQRQNPNLGKFTSGELAFTRDTGRVFVGNFSDDPKTSDLQYVQGGILTGNKYLGIIDSRPIAYEQQETTGITGFAGLSYENDNEGIYTEKALFKDNTRVKKDGKVNDWKNDPSFNRDYGTYNGDYLYDLWRNALIIFDNNIKPYNNDIIVENPSTKYEVVKDSYGNDITTTSVIRTPIEDYSNESSMKDYPIYGNGYVIFRLIEPDGKTIRFKERESTSKFTEETGNWEKTGNWNHNILEVDFSANNVIKALHTNDFKVEGDKIRLNGLNMEYMESQLTAQLPSIVSFGDASNRVYYDFKSNMGIPENPSDTTTENPSDTTSDTTTYFLTATYGTTSSGKNGFILSKTSNLSDFITNPTQSINIETDGTILVNESQAANGSSFKLSLKSSASYEGTLTEDPWDIRMIGEYAGTGKYASGILIGVNEYGNYKATEDDNGNITSSAEQNKIFGEKVLGQYASTYNSGINYLKKPLASVTEMHEDDTTSTIKFTLTGTTISGFISECYNNEYYRVIPSHAESIILQVTVTTGTTCTINHIDSTGPILFQYTTQTSGSNFVTTVEIPLIPVKRIYAEKDDDNNDITYIDKKFSYYHSGGTIKLLGYRL